MSSRVSTFLIAAGLLLSSPFLLAQSLRVDGFLGVPFGTPLAAARAHLDSRSGAKFDSVESGVDVLIYEGGVVDGIPVDFIQLDFGPEGLHTASATFVRPTYAIQVPKRYRELKAALAARFGRPRSDYFPDRLGVALPDEEALLAIRSGSKRAMCFWYFPANLPGEARPAQSQIRSANEAPSLPDNVVSLEITEDLDLVVTYQSAYYFRRLPQAAPLLDSARDQN